MTKETISMSLKELDRLQIIRDSVSRQITQEQAADRIGISIRQVKRLVQRDRIEGPQGLVSRRRGQRPNNAFTSEFRTLVISLVRDKYPDFGPTFACEKLREIHGLALSAETLRKWMVEEGLWRERRRKIARIYQRRQQRPCYGELIQIDGSPHDWFEERGPRCTLLSLLMTPPVRLWRSASLLQKRHVLTWKRYVIISTNMGVPLPCILTDTVFSA